MDLIDLGKQPVSDANPAGDDARYEPEYEELQSEIDKLSSATAVGEVDWKRVVKASFVILSKKSKDIKVASYLAVALIHLKGAQGLSTGTQILLDLVNGFWDTMYPAKKRMRGRFNAVSWWSDSAEKYLQNYEGEEISAELAEQLSQRLGDLDSALADKAEDAPMLNRLMDAAARLPVAAPAEPEAPAADQATAGTQPTSAPRPAAAPVAPQSVAPAVTPAPVGHIASHDDYRKALRDGLSGLAVISDYLLVNDPADRVGYRLRRIEAWMPILALPPADSGMTMIPGPDKMVVDGIARQLESRDFSGALLAAESRVGQYLFWLDLSRLTVEALDALGGQFTEARNAVESETALFAQRLKGIEKMTFADGTPFADGKTKAWLKSLSREEAVSLGGGDAGESASAKVFQEASRLAKDKKIFDAVMVMQNSLSNTPSGRERCLLRLGLIRLLTDVGQSSLAHAHVEELLENIKEFRLETWEPDLALDGLRVAYDALTAEGGETAAALAKTTLQRIGRLNPAVALKINGLN